MKKRFFNILITLTMAFAAITLITAFAYADNAGMASVKQNNVTVQDNSSTSKSDLKQESKQELAPEQAQVILLQAKQDNNNKYIKLSWNKIDNARTYVVFGNKCGKVVKKLATVKKNSYTVKKIKGTNLKKHQAYKFYVIAYDGKTKLSSCKTIRFILGTTMGKYANVASIKANNSQIKLVVGATKKISATYKISNGKKHLPRSYGKTLRYYTDNEDIATVDTKGIVKAVGEGIANIYIQDLGGKYCKTKVACNLPVLTLNFDANGGEGQMQPMQIKYGDLTNLYSNAFSRGGYKFKYWNTKADGSGIPYANEGIISITENITLYAQWELTGSGGGGSTPADPSLTSKYSVFFDYMGHGINKIKTVDEGKTVSAPSTPSAAGYSFNGWYKDPDFTQEWKFNEDLVNEDTMLYAKWTPQSYTISFDVNGGNTLSPSTMEVVYGAEYGTLPVPTRAGHTFKGWFTKAASGKEISEDTNVSITQNQTIYAHWEINTYTITFNPDDHGYPTSNILSNVKYGTVITKNGNKVTVGSSQIIAKADTGYEFDKWNGIPESGTITEDITITPVFKIKKFTVSFNLNGHGQSIPSQTIDYNANASKPQDPPEDNGFVFAGWFADENCTSSWDFINQAVTKDIVLYAKWVKKHFNITYMDKGANNFTGIHEEGYPTTHTYGVQTLLKKATKDGYCFDGWYLNKTCTGSKVTYLNETDYTADITLYANWLKVNKGDLITLDGKPDVYRVIKVDGTRIEVLAMTGPVMNAYSTWNEETCLTEFSDGNKYLKYEGSNIDNYLSEAYYNSLSTAIRNAIVPQTIGQTSYSFDSEDPGSATYTYQWDFANDYSYVTKVADSNSTIERKVYVLDIEDVYEYFNDDVVKSSELNLMYFNDPNRIDRYAALRSPRTDENNRMWGIRGPSGSLGYSIHSDRPEVHASFTVDLSTGLEWEEYKLPEKGDIISIDGQSDAYRVIKVEGMYVELLAMESKESKFIPADVFDTETNTFTLEDGSKYVKYEGSTLDNYLNGNEAGCYYAGLSENIKNAIVAQKINQYVYQYDESYAGEFTYQYQQNYSQTNHYITELGSQAVSSNRKVYALDVKDIYDYIGNTKLSSEELNMMFYNQKTSTGAADYIWLRSAQTDEVLWSVNGNYGSFARWYYGHNYKVRAAFTADMAKLSWELLPVKGDLITLDGQEDVYRIIKVDGSNVEVMAMSGEPQRYYTKWNEEECTTEFSNGEKYAKYDGSNLDTYLNQTYYERLTENIKNAIVPQVITQNVVQWSTADPGVIPGSIQYTNTSMWFDQPKCYITPKAFLTLSEKRKVYALDVQDVYDYFGKNNVTDAELLEMFFNSTTPVNSFCRLRSAAYTYKPNMWSFYGNLAILARHSYYDSDEARAAFTVDLTKCTWARL